jgi:hypothetical protein
MSQREVVRTTKFFCMPWSSRPEAEMAHNLIASDRVEGTAVCRPNGKKIGVIVAEPI